MSRTTLFVGQLTAIALLLTAAGIAFGAEIPPDSKNLITPGTDWPWWQGAGGNNSAVVTGQELVDDLSQARKIWESGEQLGTGKTCSSGDWSCGDLQIGYGSPVVANGKVYLYYYWPSGTVHWSTGSGRLKDLIDADDVIL